MIKTLPFFVIKKRLINDNDFLEFEEMSSVCANYLGWKDPELCYGKYDYDIPSKISELASDFKKFDLIAIAKDEELQTIELLDCPKDGLKVFLVKRVPQGEKIVICAIDISSKPIFSFIRSSLNYFDTLSKERRLCYILDDAFGGLNLSSRQEECLYYLIRGKTAGETARVLGIEEATVQQHIVRIKDKLKCHTKSDLIDRSFESGFVYFIPKSVLEKEKL